MADHHHREALFQLWHDRGIHRLGTFVVCLDRGWLREAAFDLHQACESFFGALLLVYVGRKPWSHDLRMLARTAAQVDPALAAEAVFPNHRSLFDKLNWSCEASRYDVDFSISVEELKALAPRVRALGVVVHRLCRARLDASG